MSPYGTTQRFESPVDSVDIATRPALKGVDKGVDGLEAAQKLADTRKAAHPLTHPPAPCPPCPQGQGNKVLNKRGKERKPIGKGRCSEGGSEEMGNTHPRAS